MQTLESLRQRRLARSLMLPSEPKAAAADPTTQPTPVSAGAPVPSKPEGTLNRHGRRALAAMGRRAA